MAVNVAGVGEWPPGDVRQGQRQSRADRAESAGLLTGPRTSAGAGEDIFAIVARDCGGWSGSAVRRAEACSPDVPETLRRLCGRGCRTIRLADEPGLGCRQVARITRR